MTASDRLDHYDIIVVGGGLSGLLAASRLAREQPQLDLLILEKESHVGGRIRSSLDDGSQFGCGLKGISTELFNYWNQNLKQDPSGKDLPAFQHKIQKRLGILQAGAIQEIPLTQAFGTAGAKAIAGGAGVRDWHFVAQVAEEWATRSQSFAKAFKGNKKSPSAIVLEHLCHLWGVSDLWGSEVQGIIARAGAQSQNDSYVGRWEDALDELVRMMGERVTVETNNRVVLTERKQDVWQIKSEKRLLTADRLIVAMPIWETMPWFPRNLLPKPLVQLLTRAKPTSLVVLSDTIQTPHDLPDVLLIPAEDTQVIVYEKEISFQATLDFELTMQAPDVVKAVKRLKRARRKLGDAVPSLKFSGDHIALVPVGWAQPLAYGEQRYLEKMSDFQTPELMFCGDSYGTSVLGDQNVLASLASISHIMSPQKG